jgi:hypothetical protein
MDGKEHKLMVIGTDDRPNMDWISMKCPKNNEHYMILKERRYAAVPMEKKQAFLDLWRKGELNLGEAAKEVGITSEVAGDVILNSIDQVSLLGKKVKK